MTTCPVPYDQKTILVLSGNGDFLAVASTMLSRENRILRAWHSQSALWLCATLPVDAVVIDHQTAGCRLVELECRARGIQTHFMSGTVEGGIIKLMLPQIDSPGYQFALDRN